MAMKFFGTAQGLPWIASLSAPNDDQYSDRLNHRFTTGFLLVCAVIATGMPLAMNRITCWVPAQFVGAYGRYTENYCWISNTYYVPTNQSIPRNIQEREQAEIGYYQWVPFLFLLSAFGFYLPRMLWRAMNTRSGIDLQFLISKKKDETIVSAVEQYCQSTSRDDGFGSRFCRTLFCTSGKRLGNYLCSIYVMSKFLYLVNSFVQLLLIHKILALPGFLYGFEVWRRVFVENSVLTDSPYFPRVTLCDLRVREVGNLHRYTVQCVLPINMLNEKLFSLAWFWFFYVVLVNLWAFVVVAYDNGVEGGRFSFVDNLYRKSMANPSISKQLVKMFTHNVLMQDGVLILKLVERNAPGSLAAKVVRELLSKYEKEQTERIRSRSQSPPPLPPATTSETFSSSPV